MSYQGKRRGNKAVCIDFGRESSESIYSRSLIGRLMKMDGGDGNKKIDERRLGGGHIISHIKDDNRFSALGRHGARYSCSDLGLPPLEGGTEKTHHGWIHWSAMLPCSMSVHGCRYLKVPG